MKLSTFLRVSFVLGLLFPVALYAQEQSISLTTSKPVGSSVTISVNRILQGFTIDWGDGVPVTYDATPENLRTVTAVTKGSDLKVSTTGNLTTFICESAGITSVNLKNADKLRSLYLPDNELTTISLSGLSEMLDLDLSGNSISRLSIPESTLSKLQNLNVANNNMERYNNYKRFRYTRASLEHANISGNLFETLVTTSNTNLKTLIANDCPFTSIDVSGNAELSVLSCDNNKLTEIVFDAQNGAPSLVQLSCNGNSIPSLVLNRSSRLKDLSCAGNGMTQIKLPATALGTMNCGDNALTFSSLPIKVRQPAAGFFNYKPQADIDLAAKGLLLQNEETGGYYITQCPSYADRNDNQYKLSMSTYRYDGSGSTSVTIDWYHVENGEPIKMLRATASQKDNDFTNTSGVYTFLQPYKEIYAELTHDAYPDFAIRTTHFAVGKDNATAIKTVEIGNLSEAKVYDLQGRRVAQPRQGIYVVDGKKVYVK